MLQDLVEQLAAALPLNESARGELCGAFDVLAGESQVREAHRV